MQAVVVFAEGLQTIPSTFEKISHPNLDKLVQHGCMGAYLPRPHPSGEAHEHSLVLQLLGIQEPALPPYDSHLAQKVIHVELTIPKRWFGTTASLISNSLSLLAAAPSLGFINASELKDLNAAHIFTNFTQALATPASKGGLDLCLLHLRSPHSQAERERNIHYAAGIKEDEKPAPPLHSLRPAQSYEWKDGKKITNFDARSPLYALWHHQTSTRRDECKTFSEKEAAARGANKQILLEHFFGEVAFKIGRAPKYGA